MHSCYSRHQQHNTLNQYHVMDLLLHTHAACPVACNAIPQQQCGSLTGIELASNKLRTTPWHDFVYNLSVASSPLSAPSNCFCRKCTAVLACSRVEGASCKLPFLAALIRLSQSGNSLGNSSVPEPAACLHAPVQNISDAVMRGRTTLRTFPTQCIQGSKQQPPTPLAGFMMRPLKQNHFCYGSMCWLCWALLSLQ